MSAALDAIGPGTRALVMGLGRFGGGAGVTRFLVDRGAHVTITDMDPPERLARAIDDIADLVRSGGVELKLGGHDARDFARAEVVIVNPAVPRPWENPYIEAARAAGALVTTEIQLAIESIPESAAIVGVTGTAGKSTTASMVHHVLAGAGVRSVLGGNIGGSILTQRGPLGEARVVELELSSAMLHWLSNGRCRRQLDAAVVTSYAPNHVDWHGTEAHYLASKQHLTAMVRPGGRVVLGPGVHDWAVPSHVERVRITNDDAVEGLAIPGSHNAINAACALAACSAWVGADDARRLARSFPGLEHRLKLVHEHDGVRWFDDSKSTTPEATLIALDALAAAHPHRVHLIVGGYDKRIDLSAIARAGARAGGLYCIGATGPGLASAATAHGSHHAFDCGTLEVAVAQARARANTGDAVLLSPGCASWDQFENFEHRGRVFAELARGVERVP